MHFSSLIRWFSPLLLAIALWSSSLWGNFSLRSEMAPVRGGLTERAIAVAASLPADAANPLAIGTLLESIESEAVESEAVESSRESSLSPDRIEQIRQLRIDAFEATSRGEFGVAEAAWTQLLDWLPEEPALWSNRGNVRVSQNKLEAAMADYDRAIELAPEVADPYLNRGLALEALGRWEEAIADYDRVLAIDPKDVAAYNNRGNARAGLGDWAQALVDYEQAAEMAPNFAMARANYALALYQVGQPDASIRTMRNLLRKYPQFADMRAALTAALWVSGKQGEAESNWVAAIGLDRRYQDLDWVATIRRWPPALVSALEKFLTLKG